MDSLIILLMVIVVWRALMLRYQRAHITLLGRHLSSLQLERHMETLTEGYTRAIREASESRQVQVLETFARTEGAVASQAKSLADSVLKEAAQATSMSTLPICVPYIEHLVLSLARDFRELLQIHAAGLRRVIENQDQLDPKSRAFHLSAELYLLQHSCHWFCKSRSVADARLIVRHKVDYQKVLDSVSPETRSAYQRWLDGAA